MSLWEQDHCKLLFRGWNDWGRDKHLKRNRCFNGTQKYTHTQRGSCHVGSEQGRGFPTSFGLLYWNVQDLWHVKLRFFWSLIGLLSFTLLMIKQISLTATAKLFSHFFSLWSQNIWVKVWPRMLMSEGLDLRGCLGPNSLDWDMYTEDNLGHIVNIVH